MVHDRLSCIMAAINHERDREGREYGARYGQFVADITERERDEYEMKGRRILRRREEMARKLRERRKKPPKGEGRYI